ncbi:RloB family protein [Massilia antarctica]|uniref:RloB family protein n=1 Tax=Massilia antarctica TaxID=2765360 RepID=UPI0009EA080F|nr:RloB family protein [Massilia sp. H27-R4]MCY0912261.1 RloB family protein [Massilia sp. H27-R4]
MLTRKSRPLTRDIQDFRDDRLFIVACDDTYAPLQYFGFFSLNRVKIHVVPTVDGTSHAEYVLDRLMSYECNDYDERWMILDTDHCIRDGHIRSFIRVLRDAANKGVQVAVSRSCFEVWLLLHHVEPSAIAHLRNATETAVLLKSTLGAYDKKLLKKECFPLSSVVAAFKRAEEMDSAIKGTHIPKGVTTRVFKLWKSIIDGASPQQLPAELLSLRNR